MGAFFLTNLPYLVVYLIGIWIAVKRRQGQPGIFTFWAIFCYGLLIVLLAVRLWQVGTIINALEHNVWKNEPRWFIILGYVRTVLFYVTSAGLMAVALCWRRGTDDRRPLMLVIVSVALTILSLGADRLSIAAPGLSSLLFLITQLGASITLIMAVYGWRKS